MTKLSQRTRLAYTPPKAAARCAAALSSLSSLSASLAEKNGGMMPPCGIGGGEIESLRECNSASHQRPFNRVRLVLLFASFQQRAGDMRCRLKVESVSTVMASST